MVFKFLSAVTAFLLINVVVQAQEVALVKYSGAVVIPNNYPVDGSVVGGLSGITFDRRDSSFHLTADKPPARIYKVNITPGNTPEVTWRNVLKLSPEFITSSELEGIAINTETSTIYVSDEQKEGTRILELDATARFTKVIEPQKQSFMPLSGYNSGIEGLTITSDLEYLFYAFERPPDNCNETSLVRITKISLTDPLQKTNFFYKIHAVEHDVLHTNGITDIIAISNTTLLVMERAYIPMQGNVVRLYEANLDGRGLLDNTPECQYENIIPLESKLLLDFAEVTEIAIDNAEGMTFNADRSKLYIVTDNNFSREQETQIIVLDVEWK